MAFVLWLPLFYHPVHSSQFCMTAQGLSATNGMQIKTGGKGFPSKSSTVEEWKGGGMCWGWLWRSCEMPLEQAVVMEAKGWMQPHGH